MVFQGSFQDVSRVFQESFNSNFSRLFQGRLKGVSREFERNSGNFREISNVFQWCFKEVSRVCQESF